MLLGKLAKDNYMLVKDPADAEVVIVNTCGFIEASKKESIDTILDVAKLRKSGNLKSLVVGGCLAHRYGDDLKKELPEIDILFGLNDVENVVEQIKGNPLSSFVKEASSVTHDHDRAPLLPNSLHRSYLRL